MVLKHQSNSMHQAALIATFTALLGMPTASLAESVRLRSYDGSLNITGEFIAYGKEGFSIETPLGPLLVASSLVACEGAACPPIAQVHADLRASGYVVLSDVLTESEALLQKPHYCPHSAIPVASNANS